MSATSSDNVAIIAHAEAGRMRESVAEATADRTVTMTVAQFRRLAALLDDVATRASRCDGDCFNAPVGGVRLWVPLAQLEAERAHHAALLEGSHRPVTGVRFAF